MSKVPAINHPWPEQGGIYIGARLIAGAVHHIVIPGGIEHDVERVELAKVAQVIPTEINGHSDWRAPDQEDLMLAYINAREHFQSDGADSYYWSRSEYHGWPWAVDFVYGFTSLLTRNVEFRVRPVRSFPDSYN